MSRQGDGTAEQSGTGGGGATYFDLSVEHGIGAARATGIPGASKSARSLAEHLVAEVVRTGEAPRVRVEAAVLAAWAMLGNGQRRRTD